MSRRREAGAGRQAATAVALLFGAAACLAQVVPATDPMTLLAQVAKGYSTGAADASPFTQIYTPAGFATAKRESGTVWVQAPQRLRFDYVAPEKKVFTYDDGEGRFFSPDDKQVTVHKLSADERARLPIVFLEKPEELARRYEISLEAGKTIVMKPRAADSELAWLKLTITAAGHRRDPLLRGHLGQPHRVPLRRLEDREGAARRGLPGDGTQGHANRAELGPSPSLRAGSAPVPGAPAPGSPGCGLDRTPDPALRSGSRGAGLLPPFGRETSRAANGCIPASTRGDADRDGLWTARRPTGSSNRIPPCPRNSPSTWSARSTSQEVLNAVQQASKEIATRFDFRGSKSKVEWNEKELELTLTSDDEHKLKSVVDILETRLVKRGIAVKSLDFKKIEPAANTTVRQIVKIQQGIPIEKAKEIVKAIKDRKIKVQASIQADQVRVAGRDKDGLQEVQALLRGGDFGVPLQFTNYR